MFHSNQDTKYLVTISKPPDKLFENLLDSTTNLLQTLKNFVKLPLRIQAEWDDTPKLLKIMLF